MTALPQSTQANETAAADRLWAAAENGSPCAPVRDLIGSSDLDAAYRVQDHNIRRAIHHGARVVGRKIGLTSRAVQQQLGVDTPDVGVLLDTMWYAEDVPIPPDAVLQPRIEAEVALVLGRDISLERPTVSDIGQAVEVAVPALEIVGSRIDGWDIQLCDTIADNASSGAFVLGRAFHAFSGVDLAAVTVSIVSNGAELSSGRGSDCLGHPLNGAAWLARQLAASGSGLREGDVILTGALGPIVTTTSNTDYLADFGEFGCVRTAFG
jgi:2-keto-4-pentenoate hydratase